MGVWSDRRICDVRVVMPQALYIHIHSYECTSRKYTHNLELSVLKATFMYTHQFFKNVLILKINVNVQFSIDLNTSIYIDI